MPGGFFSRARSQSSGPFPRALKNNIMMFSNNLMKSQTMNTIDTLTLKALQLKDTFTGSSSSPLLDHLLETNESAKAAMRNICAFIHPDLFERVEGVGKTLGLSKRQMVEMALIDFMQKVDEVMERHDVHDAIEAYANANNQEA